MPKQSDIDLKSFITAIGKLIDARLKTQAVIMKADMRAEIKVSEERLKAELASKEDIKDMATKQDIARLEGKLDETKDLRKLVDELRRRLDHVEVELESVKSRN